MNWFKDLWKTTYLKLHDPWIAFLLFLVGLVMVGAGILAFQWEDSLFFLFMFPIFLAAIAYPRRVYLGMGIALMATALVVTVYQSSHYLIAMRNNLFATAFELMVGELLFRRTNRQRLLEKELRASQEEYRSLIAQIPLGLYRTTVEGKILLTNPALVSMFGFTNSDEMTKDRLAESFYVDPEMRQQYLEQIKQSKGQLVCMDLELQRKNGESLWVRDTCRAKLDEKGEIISIDGTMEDVTEQKRIAAMLEQERSLLRAIIDNIPDRIYAKDLGGRKTLANIADARATGASTVQQIIGKTDFELFPAEMASRYWNDDQAVMRSGHALINRLEPSTDAEREERWILTTKVPLYDTQGNITGLIGVGRDITERRQVEESLQKANQKLTSWVDELEQRNRETRLLNEMGEMLQSCQHADDAYDVIGQFAKLLFPEQRGALYVINNSRNLLEMAARWGNVKGEAALDEQIFGRDDCWALRRGRTHIVADPHDRLRCRHLNKKDRPNPLDDFESYPYFCVPMMAQGETLGILHLKLDPNDTVQAWEGLVLSTTERVGLALANLKLRESLHSQAIRDPLTGLFNRRYMEETLDREMRRAIRYQRPLGIVMLDIDHFKMFNDTFSYAAGDALLRELGMFLKKNLRGDDVTCRYGGEEFILILPESSLEDTSRRAEQLREGCKHLDVSHRGQSLGTVSISLGVAAYPQHGNNSEEVLRAVDTALHSAKSEGRDRVIIAKRA